MIEEHTSNIVVVPADAQLAHLNQLWLYKHGVLSEAAQGLFTPVAVQAGDSDMDLLLLPNRIQIIAKRLDIRAGWHLAADRLRKLLDAGATQVGALTAVGLNAQVFWSAPEGTEAEMLIERALVRSGPLFESLAETRQVGVSITERLGAVSLTMKLEHAKSVTSSKKGVGLDFNVHMDLVSAEQVPPFLDRLDEFAELVGKRIDAVERAVLQGAV